MELTVPHVLLGLSSGAFATLQFFQDFLNLHLALVVVFVITLVSRLALVVEAVETAASVFVSQQDVMEASAFVSKIALVWAS